MPARSSSLTGHLGKEKQPPGYGGGGVPQPSPLRPPTISCTLYVPQSGAVVVIHFPAVSWHAESPWDLPPWHRTLTFLWELVSAQSKLDQLIRKSHNCETGGGVQISWDWCSNPCKLILASLQYILSSENLAEKWLWLREGWDVRKSQSCKSEPWGFTNTPHCCFSLLPKSLLLAKPRLPCVSHG